jgi:hypothetical protein
MITSTLSNRLPWRNSRPTSCSYSALVHGSALMISFWQTYWRPLDSGADTARCDQHVDRAILVEKLFEIVLLRLAREQADAKPGVGERVAQRLVDAVDVVRIDEHILARLDVLEDHRQAQRGEYLFELEHGAAPDRLDLVERRRAVDLDSLNGELDLVFGLPSPVLPVRERRVSRRVATDCFVDIDTIRYSVPHRLVQRRVDVLVGEHEVVIFDGRVEVARHRRHAEPHQRVADPRHFEGIFRRRDDAEVAASSPIGRSLDVYADCVGGAA